MIWTFGGARSPGRGNMPFAAATFLAGLVHRTLSVEVRIMRALRHETDTVRQYIERSRRANWRRGICMHTPSSPVADICPDPCISVSLRRWVVVWQNYCKTLAYSAIRYNAPDNVQRWSPPSTRMTVAFLLVQALSLTFHKHKLTQLHLPVSYYVSCFILFKLQSVGHTLTYWPSI